MKKHIILLSTLMIGGVAYSQVGINTENPKTILDVNAKRNISGTITDNSQTYGLQAPRLTRAELTANTASYNADQKGALIYITDVLGGDTTSPRTFIDAEGYYYFDGTLWQKIGGGGAGADINIYKDNGTLVSNRTVAQANKTLSFTSTATTGTSHFSIDGTTFSVDAVNKRIGIGTTAPTNKLDINGGLRVRTVPAGTSGVDAIAVDSDGNVVKVPASESSTILVRNEIAGASWNQTQTIPPSIAPTDYPYLKSITVSLFNSLGKTAITGILVKQNSILACSGIGGSGTNICTTNLPQGGTISLDVGTAPGFKIILNQQPVNVTNPGLYSNLYYVAEYSKN